MVLCITFPPSDFPSIPWFLSNLIFLYNLELFVTIIPPWPVVIVLLAVREKQPKSPIVPKYLFFDLEKSASAASSIIFIFLFLIIFFIERISAALPEIS